MGKWFIPMLIGIILAVGFIFWYRYRGTTTSSTAVATPARTTVKIENQSLVLEPDRTNRLVLKSESQQGGQPVAPIPTIAPTKLQADGAGIPAPTVVAPSPLPATPLPTIAAVPQPTAIPPTVVQPTAAPPIGNVGNQLINYIDYTVQSGDTMFSIAQKPEFNTTIGLMAQAGILSDYIMPGQVIRIPVVNSAGCPSGKAHIVEQGQNVFRLAMRYGTTQEAIRDWNALPANYLIRTGDILCIP